MHSVLRKSAQESKQKLIPVYVYRNGRLGDCTNGGVSARYDVLYIECDEGCWSPDEVPTESIFKVVARQLFGQTVYHLEPVAPAKGVGWMSGGNYAASSDGRFSRMIGGMYGAVSIHDRDETQEQYDQLSR